jgi:hypothetical protein
MKQQKFLKTHHHLLHFVVGFGVLVGFIVLPMSDAIAQTTVENPQSGSIGVNGLLEGDPPTEAAVITSPNRNQSFSDNPIRVAGTCIEGLLIQIYRNDTFVGSTVCLEGGQFDLQVDLVTGQNSLYARVFDGLNQEGPRSTTVVVSYTPSGDEGVDSGGQGGGVGIGQLLITSNFSSFGVDPGTELSWPINLVGGSPPYALSWDWGDGTTDLYSVVDSGAYDGASHTYDTPGTYRVIVKVTDADGRRAYIELIAIVNGQATAGLTVAGGTNNPATVNRYIRWPLYVVGALIVPAFIIGRRYEHRHRDRMYQKQREQQSHDHPWFIGHTPSPQH